MLKFLLFASFLAASLATPIRKGSALYGEYFQGDIRLTDEQKRLFESPSPSTGWIPTQFRWPMNLQGFVAVPYRIQASEGFTQAQINWMLNEFRIIESHTCIRFVDRTNQIDFVEIINGNGCWSWLGRLGGRQELSMSVQDGCLSEGIAIHEAYHALGYDHMHNHIDRDNFVQIFRENILQGMEHNFDRVDPQWFDNFNTPYDYWSIMHYPRWAFTRDWALDTIVPHDRSLIDVIGATQISSGDITRLLRMYNCINH